jgi:succinyl-CoA synthetase beta subunit
MKLHEYQAKDVFRRFEIPVPHGKIIATGDEAAQAARTLNGPPWVVKAQVHAGGRGQGGGVKVVQDLAELKEAAEKILENPLVTKQTGPQGKRVHQLLIEEGIDIDRELYIAVMVDRANAMPVMIFSQMGGMDIEAVAEKSPGLVHKQFIDPRVGWMPYQGRKFVYAMDPLPSSKTLGSLTAVMAGLYNMFVILDCSLAEINPLVITKEGKIMALDAKVSIDDNALVRQKEMAVLDDVKEKDPLDAKAEEYNLNYIRLEGNIGCMVNGAGLAMATMDVVKFAGAEPANFLDVGGGASEDMIKKGLEIILEDGNVKAILINIFGGILRCDVLARGVVAAAKKTKINVPLIVRLEGTNAEEGRKILSDSDLQFRVAQTMAQAAEILKTQIDF